MNKVRKQAILAAGILMVLIIGFLAYNNADWLSGYRYNYFVVSELVKENDVVVSNIIKQEEIKADECNQKVEAAKVEYKNSGKRLVLSCEMKCKKAASDEVGMLKRPEECLTGLATIFKDIKE